MAEQAEERLARREKEGSYRSRVYIFIIFRRRFDGGGSSHRFTSHTRICLRRKAWIAHALGARPIQTGAAAELVGHVGRHAPLASITCFQNSAPLGAERPISSFFPPHLLYARCPPRNSSSFLFFSLFQPPLRWKCIRCHVRNVSGHL